MKTLLGANKWVTTGYLNYGDLYNEEQTMVGSVCGWRDTNALKRTVRLQWQAKPVQCAEPEEVFQTYVIPEISKLSFLQ